MILNYIKVALRYIWNQKIYSLIKIGGLAMGIAAFLLLALYLQNELSYDDFYPKKDRIYRVTSKYLKEGFSGVDFPAPFSKALQNDFPEVEKAGRYIPISWFNQIRPANKAQDFHEEGMAYVDVELLEILDIPLVSGDYSQSMKEPYTLLISESKARKHFADTNPIDQLLIINNDEENAYRVVGVFKDFPTNSHLDFDFMISLAGVEFWPGEQTYWGANMYDVYTLLKPGVDVEQLNDKIQNLTEVYFLPSWIEREFSNPQEIAANIELGLQPIEDIYLASSDIRDDLPHGSKQILWLFGFSGILIIFIACVNFINLSTARSSLRAKEIGMRRVVGAHQGNIIKQFLTESVIFSLCSLVIGILLAWFFHPMVNQLSQKSLDFSLVNALPVLVGLTILLGLITGIYPSFYLSKLGPVSPKGRKTNLAENKSLFRSSLVVFQFVISVTLIICTIVVFEQMQYILNKDLGFDKEQVIIIKGTNVLEDKITTFKKELLQLPTVSSVSISDYLPVEEGQRYSDSFWKEGRQSLDEGVNAQIWRVDHDYMQTLGLKTLVGRGFSKNLSSDSNAIVISRSLSDKLALSKSIGTLIGNKERSWEVIGVMEDFHTESFKNEITPTCLILENSPSMMSVKTIGTDSNQILTSIEQVWNEMSPMTQFRYDFLEDRFAFMHKEISTAGKLFNGFALLSVFIACLGLFSLTTFIAERRKKEIGIRKVSGASIVSIVRLLSKDFVLLVFLAILIAIPSGWYIMKNWLEGFAYKVNLSWSMFAIAAALGLLITVATVSYQAVRAALLNPVDSLRSE